MKTTTTITTAAATTATTTVVATTTNHHPQPPPTTTTATTTHSDAFRHFFLPAQECSAIVGHNLHHVDRVGLAMPGAYDKVLPRETRWC